RFSPAFVAADVRRRMMRACMMSASSRRRPVDPFRHEKFALKSFDLLPERFKILVVQGHEFDFFFPGDFHGALEPFARFVKSAYLTGVTGEVVRDCRFVGKFLRRGQQGVRRRLQSARMYAAKPV